MGKVYLSHTPGGRPVALKVIRPEFAEDPEFRRRFAQEVRAAERVQGLYTAPVIDSETEGPQPWLATAYVSGPTLADAVIDHGPLPAQSALLLTAGVAEALQIVHGAGIVHRDLKPSNVLLAADGPRVIDFGIARAADTTAITGRGVTVGTPAFMSPEQAEGSTVGPPSDVFALGQVAAFASLGRSAHGDGPSHAVLYRIVHQDPDLVGLPVELDELVRRCLAKDPGARPSLSEVLELCNAASDATQLRRPERWLPGSLAEGTFQRYAAPVPSPTVPDMSSVPVPVPQLPPTMSAPPAQMPRPSSSAYGLPQSAQPVWGMSPAASGSSWIRRGGVGVVLACVTVGVLFLVALGQFIQGRDSDGADDQQPSGAPATGSSESASTADKAPKPESQKNFHLSDGYYLDFSEQPLTPDENNLDDLYLSCGAGAGCSFGHYDSRIVLLDQGQKGSLDGCKQETRYMPQSFSTGRLSPGRQLCITAEDGLIALVTFKGTSPSTSASRYVTLDITIWRDAVQPEE